MVTRSKFLKGLDLTLRFDVKMGLFRDLSPLSSIFGGK